MKAKRESGSNTIYSPKWRKFRLMILRRDGFECRYCSADATAVDHIVSRVQGGDIYDPNNCQAICKACNSAKGSSSSASSTLLASLAKCAAHAIDGGTSISDLHIIY